jgi:hypothetical protein
MSRDPEVTQLEAFILTDEHIERRQVTVQALAAMEDVECLQDRGDLPPDKRLRLPLPWRRGRPPDLLAGRRPPPGNSGFERPRAQRNRSYTVSARAWRSSSWAK